MDPWKSSGIYLDMFIRLYVDIADSCDIPTRERNRDRIEIRRRFSLEGLGFLTKTLPRLGKCLDKALARDEALVTPYFSVRSGVPNLFGYIWRQCFDSAGILRSDAKPHCISGLRQLCSFLYKLEVPFTTECAERTITKFVETDLSLPSLEDLDSVDSTILKCARHIVSHILGSRDYRDITPRHGPGAVSTGEAVHEKGSFKRFFPELHAIFPYDQHMVSGLNHLCDLGPDPFADMVVDIPTAQVNLVPKDSRGPRIISCEPLEIQWVQQGVLARMVDNIENHDFCRGFINFTDQSINRTLAQKSSLNGKLGTFDMKDASDRVSLALVLHLFGGTNALPALLACRSEQTLLPSGVIHKLRKFAPMGSAICFPTEALCFFALITAVRMHKHRDSIRYRISDLYKYRPYVYGDDLIFNIEDYDVVEQFLSRVGLLLNKDKCCVGTSFRESCGMDAFQGVDVTPLRCKALWSHESKGLVSYVALGNAAWKRGYYCLSEFIFNIVEEKFGYLPYVEENAPALGWTRGNNVHLANKRLKVRFSRTLFKPLVRAYVLRPHKRASRVAGWSEVLRNMHGTSRDASGLYTSRRRVSIHRRWVPFSL